MLMKCCQWAYANSVVWIVPGFGQIREVIYRRRAGLEQKKNQPEPHCSVNVTVAILTWNGPGHCAILEKNMTDNLIIGQWQICQVFPICYMTLNLDSELLDLQKVSDTVDHSILLSKLWGMDFGQALFQVLIIFIWQNLLFSRSW